MAVTHLPDSGNLVHPSVIAQDLDVSVRTIQRMADDGEIPHYRVRGQLRFNIAEVRAALRVDRPSC